MYIINEGNAISNKIGEAMFYLIDITMDILNNQDIIDYKKDIKIIENIIGVDFDKLKTKSILKFLKKEKYNMTVNNYIEVYNEVKNIVDIKNLNKNVSRLENMYY
jgi:hypothetical protein